MRGVVRDAINEVDWEKTLNERERDGLGAPSVRKALIAVQCMKLVFI